MTANELSIVVSAKDLASGTLKRMASDIRSFGDTSSNSFLRAKEASESFAIGVGIVAAAATAAVGKSVKTFASFEKTMDAAGSVMNETSEEFDQLTDLAIELGEKTSFSASQSAGAIEMLAKNGLDASQILGGALASSMNLAAAGATDLSVAADVSTDVMAIWKMEAEDMEQAVNGIAGVMTNSKFDINDFSLALAQGGGVAGSVGVEFEDFTASVAAMSPYFKSGSDAGTSFKVMLQRLVPTSKSAYSAMEDLGLITEDGANQFFDAEGNMKSMAEVAGLLNEATKDLSDEQKNLYLSTIFGTDAMRGAAAIAEHTNESFTKLKNKIADTSAEDIARAKLENLAGGYEETSGAIETASITIGALFAPAVEGAMQAVGNLAREITQSLKGVESLGQLLEENVVPIGIFSGALLGALAPAIWGVVTAVGGLTIALAPYMIGGVVIAGVLVGIYKLGTVWSEFVETVKGVWNAFLPWMQEKMEALSSFLGGKWSEMTAYVSGKWTEFISWITESIGAWHAWWSEKWTAISQFFVGIWTGIQEFVQNAWNTISFTISSGLMAVQNTWTAIWSSIKAFVLGIWENIKAQLGAFMEWIATTIASAKSVIIDTWDSVWSGFSVAVQNAWDGVMAVIEPAVDWIVSKIEALIRAFERAKGIASGIGNAVSSGWNSAKSVGSGAINGIKTMGGDILPFANGGIGDFGFGSGIKRSPVIGLAGEAGPEAIVPLPDGRSIPVTMTGGRSGGSTINIRVGDIVVEGNVTSERELTRSISETIAQHVVEKFGIHA